MRFRFCSKILLALFLTYPSAMVFSQVSLTEPRIAPVAESELTREQLLAMGTDPDNPDLRASMNLFKTMVRHPELMNAWRGFGDRVSALASMTDYDRELVIMRLAVLTNGNYEWAQHYSGAKSAGLTDEQLDAVRTGSGAAGWSDWERTLLTAAEQLHSDAFISDAVYAQLSETYNDQEIMDFIALTAHYFLVAMLTNSLGIQLDPHHTNTLN